MSRDEPVLSSLNATCPKPWRPGRTPAVGKTAHPCAGFPRSSSLKIARVASVTGPDASGKGSARVWGKLPGLPAAPDRQDFTLERWSRLTLVGAPRQPGRLIFDFVGSFECEPIDAGLTRVTHAYVFTFRRPFTWIERRMASTLPREIDEEVDRLADILDTRTGGSSKTRG